METVNIDGTIRKETGKKFAASLRRNEQIPCVLYGKQDNNIHFSATQADLKQIIYTPNVYFINLKLDGKEYKSIMHDIQFHPVTDSPLHIDFYELEDNKPLKMEIPVTVNGVAAGVREGGHLAVNARTLLVSALPNDMPSTITLDVEKLNIGDAIRIRDIESENITFLNADHAVVVAVRVTRSAKAADEAEAEQEVEEGAEGAEGAEDSEKTETTDKKEEKTAEKEPAKE